MIYTPSEDVNLTAYRRLKAEIDRTYPPGHFVAIDEGRIVADAISFAEVDARISELGRPSPEILVVQAGEADEGFGWIFKAERLTY